MCERKMIAYFPLGFPPPAFGFLGRFRCVTHNSTLSSRTERNPSGANASHDPQMELPAADSFVAVDAIVGNSIVIHASTLVCPRLLRIESCRLCFRSFPCKAPEPSRRWHSPSESGTVLRILVVPLAGNRNEDNSLGGPERKRVRIPLRPERPVQCAQAVSPSPDVGDPVGLRVVRECWQQATCRGPRPVRS